jgi:hypothetical protein
MNRRHLLKGMGAVALYSSFPAVLSQFIASCNSTTKKYIPVFFTASEYELTEALTDTIIPKTSTPGALDAQVPMFIDMVVKNCISNEEQQQIKKGLHELADQKFLSLAANDKLNIINKIDAAAFKNDAATGWFRRFKKLTLIGYFTSQEGMTKALNYVKVPDEYKACIPYKKGDKALAKTFLQYW